MCALDDGMVLLELLSELSLGGGLATSEIGSQFGFIRPVNRTRTRLVSPLTPTPT